MCRHEGRQCFDVLAKCLDGSISRMQPRAGFDVPLISKSKLLHCISGMQSINSHRERVRIVSCSETDWHRVVDQQNLQH